MYNLKERSDSYANSSEGLWQYQKNDTNGNKQTLNHANSKCG